MSKFTSALRGIAMFRALTYRNYRLFFTGQGISLIGTWMQQVAISWLVYRLTDSALMLGTIGFASQIPSFLLGPFAGVVSDRFNRHKLLIFTQCLSLVQAGTLAFLVLTGQVQIWHLIALSILLGSINAFDMAARQAFVVQMVDKREDLSNAIALNSSLFNSARLVGPSIAGVVIAAVGEGMCFLINALSYMAVIASLLMMKLKPFVKQEERQKIWKSMKEGFGYAFGFAPIRSIILLIALLSLFGMPFSVLLPVFARDILKGGAETLGFLMAASGIGALSGALYLANRKTVIGLGRVIIMATITFGAGLLAFSFSESLVFSLFFIMMAGSGMMLQMASSNTILQTIVDNDKRGRVMSFYTMAFMGMAPFGSLLAGLAADQFGAPITLACCGLLVMLSIIPFMVQLPKLRIMVRPIYQRLGILPEIAKGLQSASNLTTPPEER